MALVLLANNSSSNKLGYYWIKGGGGSDWLNIQIQKKKRNKKEMLGFLLFLSLVLQVA